MGSVSVPLTGIVSSFPAPIEAAPPAPVADGEAMLGRCSAATDGLLAGVELDVAAGLGVVVVAGGVLSVFCSHAAVRSRQSDPTMAHDLDECRNMVPPIDDRTTLFGAARRAKFVPCAGLRRLARARRCLQRALAFHREFAALDGRSRSPHRGNAPEATCPRAVAHARAGTLLHYSRGDQ